MAKNKNTPVNPQPASANLTIAGPAAEATRNHALAAPVARFRNRLVQNGGR
jgi:hypothetical protein